MNARDFFGLICNMRQAQISYFKTRSQQDLREALKLEREVDAEISRVKEILKGQALEFKRED